MSARLILASACSALVLAAAFAVRPSRADTLPDEKPAQVFKNVKVLKHVTSKTEMRRLMKEQSAALGVKCTHCHVPGKFDLDDKEAKKTARAMMEMVQKLNATYFPKVEKPPINCWTCHRGEEKPAPPPPPAPSTDPDAMEAE